MKMKRRNGWDLAKEQGVEKARGPLMALAEKHLATVITAPRKKGQRDGRPAGALGPQDTTQPQVCSRQSTDASAPQLGLLRTQPAPSGTDTPGWEASLDLGQQPDGLQSICLRQLGSRAGTLLTPLPTAPDQEGCGCNF